MWLFQRLRSATSQQDDQQQHVVSQFQSDSSVDNDKQVKVLAKGLQNLAVSTKDEVIDRYIQGQSVVIDEEQQVKQAADEDHRHLVVKEAGNEASQAKSSSESEAKRHWDVKEALKVDTEEFRVSEERETGVRCDIPREEVEYEKGYEHKESRLQFDSCVYNDKQAQVLAKGLQNLAVSTKDEVIDRYIQGQSVVIDEEQQVKQAADEDDRHLVVKEAGNEASQAKSSSESEAKRHWDVNKALKVDTEEFRVSEERETGVRCEIPREEVEYEKGYGHKDEDLKEKHEIEIEERVASSKIGNYENIGRDGREEGSVSVPDDGKSRILRPDCDYHTWTDCKFDHPLIDKNQQPTKETKKEKENNAGRHGPIECKFHMPSAGCKHGKACKFNHGKGKNVRRPVIEYNFMGLPIRPGEKECPYYMRKGFCQYGRTCRLHHPDPIAVEGSDPPTSYGNDIPPALQTTPQPNIPNMPSWSPPRTPDSTSAFVPTMPPPPQNLPPPNPDWYGFQAPAHLYPSSEQGPPIPMAFFTNNPPSDKNMYARHQQRALVSEYPERLDQPDCRNFMKTGYCKYQASCKFHHPQNWFTQTAH
ncbi:hypothetical protein R6Q57_020891 [Mikania cordata]